MCNNHCSQWECFLERPHKCHWVGFHLLTLQKLWKMLKRLHGRKNARRKHALRILWEISPWLMEGWLMSMPNQAQSFISSVTHGWCSISLLVSFIHSTKSMECCSGANTANKSRLLLFRKLQPTEGYKQVIRGGAVRTSVKAVKVTMEVHLVGYLTQLWESGIAWRGNNSQREMQRRNKNEPGDRVGRARNKVPRTQVISSSKGPDAEMLFWKGLQNQNQTRPNKPTHLRRKGTGQEKREWVRLERVLKTTFRAMGELWNDFKQVLILSWADLWLNSYSRRKSQIPRCHLRDCYSNMDDVFLGEDGVGGMEINEQIQKVFKK